MLTHGNSTIYRKLAEQESKHSNKTFLRYENQEISYKQMLEEVNRTSHWLLQKGIKKGDTVAVFLSNSPIFYEIWFACGAIGAVLLPINTASSPDELDYFLDHSESKGFIFEENLITERHHSTLEKHSLLFKIGIEKKEWEEKRKMPHTNLKEHVNASDVAGMMYTSGTTAKPKAVLVTHENYLWAGHTSVLYQQLKPTDRYLIFLPLFHVNSQYYTSMAMLVSGGTIVLMKRFSSTTFWETVKKHQPTVTSLVATIIKMLITLPGHSAEKANSLRQAGYGLFVSKKDIDHFQKRFNIRLFQWYGMTESITTNITTPLYDDMPVDPKTGILAIGKPALGNRVKIINEEGDEVPPNEVGEIIIKSPSLMKGYYKNTEATMETIRNGWLHTGDNGYYNEDGFIWFVDRNKDMIKRAGENISSIEVENVLSDHPSVEDCAVVGEPDPLREEAVIAYVKTNEEVTVTPAQLESFCKERLSYFKIPQEFRFLEDFPRTSIGKVQKNKLRN